MAYRISYGPLKQKQWQLRRGKRKLLAVLAVLALLIGFRISGLSKSVGKLLLPGDRKVTAAALEIMEQSIAAGDGLGAAFTCFCREIIENAG